MNAIYICIFNNENYVKMFYLLLESILSYGNLDDKTHILIYTSTPYMTMIKQSPLYTDKIIFEINDTYDTIEKACKARLDLFNLANIKNYTNILYLDTDIIVKGDINKVFDVIQDDILYVLEEGVITNDLWGASLFGSEINKYDDKSAFTSGILLFRNCEKVRNLFDKINENITMNYRQFVCHDQPYIVYNAFKYNMYDNKVLKKYVVNNDDNVHSNKIIHHFPGGPGVYGHKIVNMTKFLDGLKKCPFEIPKIFFQTSKTYMEKYVIDMIKNKLGSDWKYEFYSDEDIIKFFTNNPITDLPDIINKYNSFEKGAHKADLFRYYYLYVKGGFFMDSDAMIYTNINNIVKDYSFVSVNSNCHPGTIFQGILGASPKNEIIKKALYSAYNIDRKILENNYHYFCKQLYDIIKENNYGYNIKLYQERRVNPDNGDDILDGDTVIFKHYWKHKKIPIYNTQYTDEFTKIYDTNYWVRGSGAGSYVENTVIYNKYIIDFIRDNDIHIITDIGCGDWQSSYLIYQELDNIDYLGLDCVNSVIEKNKINHPKYNFSTLDILSNIDLIRDSDLYIIKDVLQHWKLKDIYDLLDKLVLKKFKYIIITNNGDQTYDNLELNAYIGNGRGLHSSYLPLKKYNAKPLLDYFGGENKHMCIISKNYTDWNNYNKSELNNFDYNTLNTFKIPNTLIRVGPKEDGGYVIVDGFEYDRFISCGIANDIRFEDAFLDIYKIKCLAFDGTIKSFPNHKNNIEWVPKNIGYFNTDKITNLKEYIKDVKKVFLKMDIEGSEFNWIDAMSEEELQNISQIVLEVHWPFDIYRMNMLKKLNKSHYIIHIHGNNYCDRDIPKHLPSGRTYDGTITFNDNVRLPEVFEITCINKNLCDNSLVEMKEIQFPTPLDYPNNPNADDIHFSIPVIKKD